MNTRTDRPRVVTTLAQAFAVSNAFDQLRQPTTTPCCCGRDLTMAELLADQCHRCRAIPSRDQRETPF